MAAHEGDPETAGQSLSSAGPELLAVLGSRRATANDRRPQAIVLSAERPAFVFSVSRPLPQIRLDSQQPTAAEPATGAPRPFTFALPHTSPQRRHTKARHRIRTHATAKAHGPSTPSSVISSLPSVDNSDDEEVDAPSLENTPEESSAASHAADPPLPLKPSCSICLEDTEAGASVECTLGHTACLACFETHVVTQADVSVGLDDMISRDGAVMCWNRPQGCSSDPFDDHFLATRVSKATFNAVMLGRRKMLEFKVRQEALAEVEAQRKAREEQLRAETNSIESQVARMRQEVISEILTDACPRCRAAFLDFEACFAISCTCGAYFCAWCLAEAPSKHDAHRHVMQCAANTTPSRSLHAPMALFFDSRRKRQERALAVYVKRLEKPLVDSLLASLSRELTDLNINPLRVLELTRPAPPAPLAVPRGPRVTATLEEIVARRDRAAHMLEAPGGQRHIVHARAHHTAVRADAMPPAAPGEHVYISPPRLQELQQQFRHLIDAPRAPAPQTEAHANSMQRTMEWRIDILAAELQVLESKAERTPDEESRMRSLSASLEDMRRQRTHVANMRHRPHFHSPAAHPGFQHVPQHAMMRPRGMAVPDHMTAEQIEQLFLNQTL